jgi:hypothetical protein
VQFIFLSTPKIFFRPILKDTAAVFDERYLSLASDQFLKIFRLIAYCGLAIIGQA